MLRILISLLDPVSSVVLIDEPEMHLYPSQKRWLGRQLVSLADEQGKQVLLVTYDPMILQRILDSPASTTILRIDLDTAGNRLGKSCLLDNNSDVGATRN